MPALPRSRRPQGAGARTTSGCSMDGSRGVLEKLVVGCGSTRKEEDTAHVADTARTSATADLTRAPPSCEPLYARSLTRRPGDRPLGRPPEGALYRVAEAWGSALCRHRRPCSGPPGASRPTSRAGPRRLRVDPRRDW